LKQEKTVLSMGLDYQIPVTQPKGVREGWRYACSKPAVYEIAHHTIAPHSVYF